MAHEAPLLGRVSDNSAQAVAAEAAHTGDYPELRQFATRGWGDRERMTAELDDAHASWCLEDGAYQSIRVWLRKQGAPGLIRPAGATTTPVAVIRDGGRLEAI